MKRYLFFIIIIATGTVIIQGIYIAKERNVNIREQKKAILEKEKEVMAYVEEMVEFPAKNPSHPFSKSIFLALSQLLSIPGKKKVLQSYLLTAQSLYYYLLGSLLCLAEKMLSMLRRKKA